MKHHWMGAKFRWEKEWINMWYGSLEAFYSLQRQVRAQSKVYKLVSR